VPVLRSPSAVSVSPVSPVSPTRVRKTCSREDCFSTYSTLAGGGVA
jgi:hypothetical protein